MRQWKNLDRTTHQSNYILGKKKKVEILKKLISNWGWDILTNPHFSRWNFLPKAFKMIFWTLRTQSRYLAGPPNPEFLSVKKSRPLDQPMRLYVRKLKWKQLRFWKKNSNLGWNIRTKLHFLRWNFLFKGFENFFVDFTDKFKVFERPA